MMSSEEMLHWLQIDNLSTRMNQYINKKERRLEEGKEGAKERYDRHFWGEGNVESEHEGISI